MELYIDGAHDCIEMLLVNDAAAFMASNPPTCPGNDWGIPEIYITTYESYTTKEMDVFYWSYISSISTDVSISNHLVAVL